MILSSLYFIFLFGRPTYLSADLRFTRILLIFVSYPEPAKRNSTISGHAVGSKCDFKMHVRNLEYPPPLQIGAPKHRFSTTSQRKGKCKGLYLRNETRYRQSVKCVENYKVSPTSCQNVMNFGPQTASNSTSIFTHPSAFHFIARLHLSLIHI